MNINGIYDLVVPLDYAALNGTKILPDAEIAGLKKAADLIKTGTANHIAWASTNYCRVSVHDIEKEKINFLDSLGISKTTIQTMVECTNTITEAENILKAHPDAKRIIIICDWRHARRAQRVWKHFFKGELGVMTTDASWNEDHPSFWCRSNIRWLLGNLIHHTLLIVRGMDSLRNVVHQVQK